MINNFDDDNKYINFLYIFIKLTIINQFPSKKYIFTFWEPREKIPGYLNLCIMTWKKFLPDYEIKLLDFSNIIYYLGYNLFSKIIYKKLPLQTQSDAIRVALLYKYGGIWIDLDTIMTNGTFLEEIKNCELAMIGSEKSKHQYIGFIYASKKSKFLSHWLNKIISKIN